MPRYVRAFKPGGTFFFTVALLERRRRLLTEHIEILREVMRDVQLRQPYRIDAIVVLPDHLHCLWTLLPDDADLLSPIRRTRCLSGRLGRHEQCR